MSIRTIKLSGGDLGDEEMFVRCNLSEAAAPVEADYCADGEHQWEPTPYQCADTRHTVSGLIAIARRLAAAAVELPAESFACDAVEV